MLTIERTKKLLNDPGVSDKEAKEIRDSFRVLAEIIFEKWQDEKSIKRKDNPALLGKITPYNKE